MSIPKVIHYCWFGGNPKSELAKKCIKSWKKKCPNYEIIEWNESNYDVTKNQYMLDAYQSKKWGFVPDYARLDIIYNYGGFYLDTDVELKKSLDKLIENEAVFGIEDSNNGRCYVNLGQGFAAEKNNVVIKELLDSYENYQFKNEDGSLNLIPSPVLNTDILCKLGYQMKNEFQHLEHCSIFPSEYFCPKSFETGIYNLTKNTISIHHFEASWFTKEQKEKYKNRIREYKIDRLIHLPNRIMVKFLGKEKYNKLKNIVKKDR